MGKQLYQRYKDKPPCCEGIRLICFARDISSGIDDGTGRDKIQFAVCKGRDVHPAKCYIEVPKILKK